MISPGRTDSHIGTLHLVPTTVLGFWQIDHYLAFSALCNYGSKPSAGFSGFQTVILVAKALADQTTIHSDQTFEVHFIRFGNGGGGT